MPKKKCRKWKEQRSSPSSPEDSDTDCIKKPKVCEGKRAATHQRRSGHDRDERKRPRDRTTILDKSSFNHNPGKEREYKKAVYRLGTASKLHTERNAAPEAGKRLSEAVGENTRNSASKIICLSQERFPKPALGGPFVRNLLSEEPKQKTQNLKWRQAAEESNSQCSSCQYPQKHVKDQEERQRLSEKLKLTRLALVKRRSRAEGASEAERHSHHSQGVKRTDVLEGTYKKSHSFLKTATSQKNLNVSKLVTQGKNELAEKSKLSGSCQREKADCKPTKLFTFGVRKETSVAQGRSIICQQPSSMKSKDCQKASASRHLHEKVADGSVAKGSAASKYPFPGRRSYTKVNGRNDETACTVSRAAEVTSSEWLTNTAKAFPDTEKVTKVSQNVPTSSESCAFTRVSVTAGPCDSEQEMLLVEELHQARSEKWLEVSVVKSYGELTCMEIDPPEEATITFHNKNHIHQDLLIVLDTNILLSHLDFVKKMKSHGLGALGFPYILIPWVVLQELDALKNGKLSGSAAHKAAPAVHYIYTCLKSQEPRLWGQSMQQAAQAICGLHAENNDDRVLQCCLQYQTLYPGGSLVLCTNDKNLCSKAILCGVEALSKADLASKVERLKNESWPQPCHAQSVTRPAQTAEGNGTQAEADAREVSSCVCVLEDTLQEALSPVLTAEMQAAYGELWQEIVFVKPPWTLSDLLQCFRKHWIAVFGNVFQRNLLKTVESLSGALCQGKTLDKCSLWLAVQQARELLRGFGRRSDYSGHLPRALSALEPLSRRLSQTNGGGTRETPGDCTISADDGDTFMAEDGLPAVRSSYQEVWAVFEDIWKEACRISSAVFSAVGFVCGSSQIDRPQNEEGFPEGAVVCLHKLITTIQQLLHIFERVLSSNCCYEDVESLFAFLGAHEVVASKPRFTAKDLFECLSQQEYREKLHVGGRQLADLGQQLERCAARVNRTAASGSWT